jgi:hypothetical protein
VRVDKQVGLSVRWLVANKTLHKYKLLSNRNKQNTQVTAAKLIGMVAFGIAPGSPTIASCCNNLSPHTHRSWRVREAVCGGVVCVCKNLDYRIIGGGKEKKKCLTFFERGEGNKK